MSAKIRRDPAEDPNKLEEGPEELTTESIYRRHARFVGRVLGRLGVPSRLLEDAPHDVCEVGHNRLPDYEDRGRLRAWLAGIALHVGKRQLRKSGRAPLMKYEGTADNIVLDEGSDPRGAAEARDLLLVLLPAVQGIERQVVFLLHFVAGL